MNPVTRNKIILYIIIFIPFFQILQGVFGGGYIDPIDEIFETTGQNALRLIIASLLVTPIIYFTNYKKLFAYRRILGVAGFCYILIHALTWGLSQQFMIDKMVADVADRLFILLGFSAFIMLLLLALTSTDRAMQKMGIKRWKQLHKLNYILSILGGVHFILQSKSKMATEPYVYMVIIAVVLLSRVYIIQKRKKS